MSTEHNRKLVSPVIRKGMLTLHVASSVAWMGAVTAFMALAIVGLTSHNPTLKCDMYPPMKEIAWTVILPLAIASFITGIISSLSTAWGLFRYYWIVFKLLITSVATVVLIIHMRPIDALAAAAMRTCDLSGSLLGMQWLMVVASGLAIVTLVATTSLSLYKPRGVTPLGMRKVFGSPQ